jgi:hypothetical protein
MYPAYLSYELLIAFKEVLVSISSPLFLNADGTKL